MWEGLYAPTGSRRSKLSGHTAPPTFQSRHLTLQQSGLAEAVIAPTLGVGGRHANDEVIEEIDIDGFGRFAELAGHLHIGRAGGGIAAGVVVGTDDRGRAVADGLAKDFARMGQAARGGAGRHFDAF